MRCSMKVSRACDEGRRNYAVANCVLRTIDIGKKCLENSNPLLHTCVEHIPLGFFDDSRNSVKWERALLAGKVEGHTLSKVRTSQRFGAATQFILGHFG